MSDGVAKHPLFSDEAVVNHSLAAWRYGFSEKRSVLAQTLDNAYEFLKLGRVQQPESLEEHHGSLSDLMRKQREDMLERVGGVTAPRPYEFLANAVDPAATESVLDGNAVLQWYAQRLQRWTSPTPAKPPLVANIPIPAANKPCPICMQHPDKPHKTWCRHWKFKAPDDTGKTPSALVPSPKAVATRFDCKRAA